MNNTSSNNGTPGDTRSIRLGKNDLITRPRIQFLMKKALQRSVTIVKAPAGYGKTRAVLEIESIVDAPFIWFFGDRSEKTMIDFYRMLLKQISASLPEDREESALSLIRENGHMQLIQIIHAAYPQGAYLILDRLDRTPIRNEVEQCIQRIIDEEGHQIRFVITTTADPGISLASLARSRQLAMITKDQLAFTQDECGSFLRMYWGKEIGENLIHEIAEFTSGWPQGIFALSQAFPTPPETLEVITESGMHSSFIPDEFEDNDFTMQGMDRELLLSMSFLPWFFPEDADKILGVSGTCARVKRITESLPFIVSGSMNRQIIDPSIRVKLMRRARTEWGDIRYREHLREVARFLIGREEWLAGLRYFLEIGDWENANTILADRNDGWIISRDPAEFLDIASYMKENRFTGPEGKLICALVAEMQGNFKSVLNQLEHMPESKEATLIPGLLRDRAQRVISGVDRQRTSTQVISEFSGQYGHGWWLGIRYIEDLLRDGDFESAESLLHTVSGIVTEEASPFVEKSQLLVQMLFQYLTGRYQSALTTGLKLQDAIQQTKSYQLLILYHILSEIHGKTGEFEKAILNERRALSLGTDLGSDWYRVLSLMNLSSIEIHRGNLDKARGWLGEAESAVEHFEEGSGIQQEFYTIRARLAWSAGAREEAIEEFEKALTFPAFSFYREAWNRLSTAHVMLRSNDPERGEKLLGDVLNDAGERDSMHLVTNALLLLAFRAHLIEDEAKESMWLTKCWSMLDIQGYRFMPASDPEIVLWVERRRSEMKSKRRSRGALIAPSRQERTARPKDRSVQAGSSWKYIQVQTLGPMRVATHGEIHEEIWKSRLKAKRFLEILLSSETFRVSADEAAEYLWPDALPDKVRHRLHNEVSNLRKIFTKIGIETHIEIKFEHSFYNLHLSDQVTVTHREFERLAQRGLDEFTDGMEESAHGFLKSAFDLYAGPFLKDALYERFTDTLRQRLSELYSSVLRALAETSYISSDESLSWWDRAIEHDPYDETAYKGAILMSIRSGHRGKAKRFFNTLKERIVDELGLPLPEWCDEEEFEE